MEKRVASGDGFSAREKAARRMREKRQKARAVGDSRALARHCDVCDPSDESAVQPRMASGECYGCRNRKRREERETAALDKKKAAIVAALLKKRRRVADNVPLSPLSEDAELSDSPPPSPPSPKRPRPAVAMPAQPPTPPSAASSANPQSRPASPSATKPLYSAPAPLHVAPHIPPWASQYLTTPQPNPKPPLPPVWLPPSCFAANCRRHSGFSGKQPNCDGGAYCCSACLDCKGGGTHKPNCNPEPGPPNVRPTTPYAICRNMSMTRLPWKSDQHRKDCFEKYKKSAPYSHTIEDFDNAIRKEIHYGMSSDDFDYVIYPFICGDARDPWVRMALPDHSSSPWAWDFRATRAPPNCRMRPRNR